jgi:ATP-dependent Clp protease ATP-binding subunit ClpC
VLLDEIEKAHPDVFNILLQVLDVGILTDSLGRRVDFKNVILIMTSNIGSRDIKVNGGLGFGMQTSKDKYSQMKSGIEEALKRVFNPEFLNRVDDSIIFHNLEREDMYKIIDIAAKELIARMGTLGITIELTKEAKEFISDKGFDPAFGARPLRRTIQKYVEDKLAEDVLKGTFGQGTKVQVKLNDAKEELEFVSTPKDQGGDEVKEEDKKVADVT